MRKDPQYTKLGCNIGPFNVPGTCTADMVDYYHVFKDGCSDGYAVSF